MCVDWRPRPLLWRRRVLPQPVVLPPVFAHFGDGGGGMLDATAEIWGRGKGGSETLEPPRVCSSSGKEERFQRVVSLLLAQRLIKKSYEKLQNFTLPISSHYKDFPYFECTHLFSYSFSLSKSWSFPPPLPLLRVGPRSVADWAGGGRGRPLL